MKGKIKSNKNIRVRVISSNIVENYLMGKNLPNSFSNTLKYFQKFNNCVLIFIRDTNIKSVSSTLRDLKSEKIKKRPDQLIAKGYDLTLFTRGNKKCACYCLVI